MQMNLVPTATAWNNDLSNSIRVKMFAFSRFSVSFSSLILEVIRVSFSVISLLMLSISLMFL